MEKLAEDDEKRIQRASFQGDPNIGLFAFATDKYVIAPEGLDTSVLRVPTIHLQVGRTNLNGIFLAGNSNGIIVPWIIAEKEMKNLEAAAKKIGVPVHKLESKHTVCGNLILCNDHGAVASPLLRKNLAEIKKVLGVRVMERNMMDLDIPGSLAVATNKGFLLSMHSSAADLKFLKKALCVDGDIGTVNFGSGFVKSGIIANSYGLIIGEQTTGPEISRITEALKFI